MASTPVKGGGSGEKQQREATLKEALQISPFPSPLLLLKRASHCRFLGVLILEAESRLSFAAVSFHLSFLGTGEALAESPGVGPLRAS